MTARQLLATLLDDVSFVESAAWQSLPSAPATLPNSSPSRPPPTALSPAQATSTELE